jgi:hypothetical protein
MTLPPLSDDTAPSSLTDDAAPARSFVERLWRAQSRAVGRGAAGRILGLSPLERAARPWFAGAVGEIDLAHRLRSLEASGEAWRVLHAVPVGGSADIDHIVIGPAGVFALTVSSSPESTSETHLRADSDLAALALAAALGRPVAVEPLVVTTAEGPRPRVDADVAVVAAKRVVCHLRGRRPVLSVEEVREITRAALRPRTWPMRVASSAHGRAGSAVLPSSADLQLWFARVRSEVAAARRVQATWAAALAAVLLGSLIEGPAIAQALVG